MTSWLKRIKALFDQLFGPCQNASPTAQTAANTTVQAQTSNYGVFNQNAEFVDSHFTFEDAKTSWESQTHQQGSIVDLETGKDVTDSDQTVWNKMLSWLKGKGRTRRTAPVLQPKDMAPVTVTPPMSKATRREITQRVGRLPGVGEGESGLLFKQLLMRLVNELNKLNLPVYEVAKKRREETEKLVPIKKFRRLMRQKEVTILEERDRITTHVIKTPSITPEDDVTLRPIRSITELKRVASRNMLALPREVLARKIVSRQLSVVQFLQDEIEEEVITESARKTIIVDEPYVEEYVDYLSVAVEPKGQLLYILADGSGSTRGYPAHLVNAMALAVLGRNLDNTSRYFYRVFTGKVHTRFVGNNPAQKRQLIQDIISAFCAEGGTDIRSALEVAASEIRREANEDDQPEILLITDGSDSFTADELFAIIGNDIILHSVIVNGSNSSLKQYSSTYVELYGDVGQPIQVIR